MTAQSTRRPSAETPFLHRLFDLLNERGLRYAVMRNYLSLPFSADGSDLDLLCSATDLGQVVNAVHEAAQNAGGTNIGIARGTDVTKITLLGHVQGEAKGWWGLRVDLIPSFRFAGQPMLDERWTQHTSTHGDIRVLPDGLAGVLGVIKEVLNNRVLPERYAGAARQALATGWSDIRLLLAPMGEPALHVLEDLLGNERSPEDLARLCGRIRQAVLMHAFKQQPIATVVRAVQFQFSKLARYANPSGLVVAILGVDGAGKSTVIEAIRPVLNAATHNALQIRHLRPGLLPALGRLKGASTTTAGPVIDPHGKAPSGSAMSLFRLTYLTADYLLGYWLLTRPQIAKLPNIVIFDRYAYDMALDPRRFRVGLSPRIAGWFARLAPKPDLVICLHGAPDVIARRKAELSTEETARQIDALLAFAGETASAVPISTDQSIEATRDEVLRSICTVLASRRRLN